MSLRSRFASRARAAFVAPAAALVEVMLPEECAGCGATAGHAAWEPAGPRVPGLRPWDRPHLCRECAGGVFAEPCLRVLGADGEAPLPVLAAAPTSARLTRVVGAWKYHGVRGLAWPFARALAAAVRAHAAGPAALGATLDATLDANLDTGAAALIAVPLHARRRRARGFNQAQVLADLVGADLGLPPARDSLARPRATAQQARLADAAARHRNLDGAFAARPPAPGRGRALLVDDLVTAGATAQAAAAALRQAGWDVAGVLALGVALARADGGDGGEGDHSGDDGELFRS